MKIAELTAHFAERAANLSTEKDPERAPRRVDRSVLIESLEVLANPEFDAGMKDDLERSQGKTSLIIPGGWCRSFVTALEAKEAAAVPKTKGKVNTDG